MLKEISKMKSEMSNILLGRYKSSVNDNPIFKQNYERVKQDYNSIKDIIDVDTDISIVIDLYL